MLPWVCAFQGSPPKTWPGLSPGLLSHASQTQRLLAVSTGVPESRSASDPPLLFVMPKHPAWRSSPHRLRAPARSQTFGRRAHRDMGSPCIVPHITAGQPMLLREPSPPYRSRRERLAVPSVRDLLVASDEEQRTPVVPFRVFGFARWPWVLPRQGRPLRISYSLRVVGLLQYRSHWLSDPTLPLAIPSALWSSCRRLRWLR
jgi:hypothetical protein